MTDDLARLVPARTALLCMDFQAGILAVVPEQGALVQRVAGTVAAARAASLQVGFVYVAFLEEDFAGVSERNKFFAPLAAARRMHVDAPAAKFDPGLKPVGGDLVLRKVRAGAFSTTDLHARLQALGIDTLVLTGLTTSGVVLSTVRDAADRDYRIFVLEDGCFDPDPHVHEVLVRSVFPRQAWVVTAAVLTDLISR